MAVRVYQRIGAYQSQTGVSLWYSLNETILPQILRVCLSDCHGFHSRGSSCAYDILRANECVAIWKVEERGSLSTLLQQPTIHNS